MFAKDFPDKLRSMILTSQVVGKKVKLKQHGREFQGLCPFHNEKTPSFTVNDLKGFYHCFGCGEHGDIISFAMKTRGLDFKEAVEGLAEEFSIEVLRVKFDAVKENKLDGDYALLEETARFFEKNLYSENGAEARAYLKKRQLNSMIAKKFRLGFSPNSYDELHKFLLSKGFEEAQLLRSGIIAKNDSGKIYDKFRRRVIFPILDKKNRVIAFGGRTLGDDLPKYLNSAETEVFKKNQTLYNYSNARKAIFDKGFALVVEGYMDVIAVAKAGVENVVAALGTALGGEHLKELFHISDKIVICLDGDAAGIKAAKRAAEIALPLISAKKTISFCFLPNQMDPDDFVKTFGVSEFLQMINAARPLSESLLHFAFEDLKLAMDKKISAENKAKIEAILEEKIALIKDAPLRKYFINSIRETLFRWDFGKKKEIKAQRKINFGSESYNYAIKALAILLKCPELKAYRDEDFDIYEINFYDQKITNLKNQILEIIINEGVEEVFLALEGGEFKLDIARIKKEMLLIEDGYSDYLQNQNDKNNSSDFVKQASPKLLEDRERLFRYFDKEVGDDKVEFIDWAKKLLRRLLLREYLLQLKTLVEFNEEENKINPLDKHIIDKKISDIEKEIG
jgi:DNA primase